MGEIQLDARTGRIVGVSLPGEQFWDLDKIEAMPKDWTREETRVSKPLNRVILPLPQTNEVVQAIARWLRVCEMSEIKPSLTDINDVDWNRTLRFHSSFFPKETWTCRVVFKDGSSFDSHDGTIFNYVAGDAYYNQEERWAGKSQRFLGPINYDIGTLQTNLQNSLREHFKFPNEYFLRFIPVPDRVPAKLGTTNFARAYVVWKDRPKGTKFKDAKAEFMAEFDQTSGDIKTFGFHDPALIRLLERAQSGMVH